PPPRGGPPSGSPSRPARETRSSCCELVARRTAGATRDAGGAICESRDRMARLSAAHLRRIARDAGQKRMYQQDKIWSRYSSDKVDIAATLGNVVRTLCRARPLRTRLDALSIGSSNEPQFRILASLFKDGLYLLDIE